MNGVLFAQISLPFYPSNSLLWAKNEVYSSSGISSDLFIHSYNYFPHYQVVALGHRGHEQILFLPWTLSYGPFTKDACGSLPTLNILWFIGMHFLTWHYTDFHSSRDNPAVYFREWASPVNTLTPKPPSKRLQIRVSHFICSDTSPETLLCLCSDRAPNHTPQTPPRLYDTSHSAQEKETLFYFFFPLWKQVLSVCRNRDLLLKRVEWMISKMCFNVGKRESWEWSSWDLRLIAFFRQQDLFYYFFPLFLCRKCNTKNIILSVSSYIIIVSWFMLSFTHYH